MPNGRNHMQNRVNLRTQIRPTSHNNVPYEELNTAQWVNKSLPCMESKVHYHITRNLLLPTFLTPHKSNGHPHIHLLNDSTSVLSNHLSPCFFKLYSPYRISKANFLQNYYSNNNCSKVQIMTLLIKLISSASYYADLLAPFNTVHASFVWW